MMPSLLIVGFPKGFTSETWRITVRATQLDRPGVSDGEILNHQRVKQTGSGWIRSFVAERPSAIMPFYSQDDRDYSTARAILEHFSSGAYCVKDVVQPYFVLQYVCENPKKYQVLFCDRSLSEIEERNRKEGWKYAKNLQDLRQRFLSYPSFCVTDALYDPKILFDALANLGYPVNRFNYLTPDFVAKRDALYDNKKYKLAYRGGSVIVTP
jgi:hypothetical protein